MRRALHRLRQNRNYANDAVSEWVLLLSVGSAFTNCYCTIVPRDVDYHFGPCKRVGALVVISFAKTLM